MARKLVVEIVGDSRQLERSLKRSETAVSRFGKGMSELGVSASLLSAGGLVAGLKQSVDAASDLNEQVSKTNQVFGKSASSVHKWAKTAAGSFGTSRRQAEATASSFGALFAPIGIVGQKAAQQSMKLTQLGADLASFYNTNVQDALDAIRSGIVGESEPLRRYGVQLSEARVQQQALADTGKTHVKQLTLQEKALARIEIIYQDTKKAQGDFQRTSQGLANQQRTLAANFDDLKTSIGEGFLPVVNDATGALNKLFGAMKNVNEWSKKSDGGLEGGARKSVRSVFKALNPKAAMRAAIPGPVQQAFRLGQHFWPHSGPGSPLGAGTPTAMRSALAPLVPAGLWLKQPPPKVLATVEQNARSQGAALRKAWAQGASSKKGKAQEKAAIRYQEQRNQWFDDMISRQMGRVGDVGLRRQLPRLRRIAKELRAALADTKDPTRRLNLADQLLDIAKQERDTQKEITDHIKKGNTALRERANTIKSAVLGQLRAGQQALEHRQELADALKQLQLAKAIGGKMGIQAASRDYQKAAFAVRLDKLEAAPARLRKGGDFAYGGVVVNVHGVTDPDAVARKVVQVLNKQKRHTSTQSRGASVDVGGSTAPR